MRPKLSVRKGLPTIHEAQYSHAHRALYKSRRYFSCTVTQPQQQGTEEQNFPTSQT